MWTIQSEKLPDNSGLKCMVKCGSREATYAEVIAACHDDATFRSAFNAFLANAPYAAFRWETPAVTADTMLQFFEFVILDNPGLARRPDPITFSKYFSSAKNGVATFSSLGGDAQLVVPCPLAEPSAYGHLAAFVRSAPESQQHVLWQAVGDAMTRQVAADPVWLNTAGGGVSWLHVRLDSRPKYYWYEPYKQKRG